LNLHILPLAIAMVAGTQLVLATLLVTGKQPISASLAYIAGFGAAVAVILIGFYVGAKLLHAGLGHHATDKGRDHTEKVVEIVLVGALILLAVRAFLNRANSKPSPLLEKVQSAGPRDAFKYGWLVILVAPTDIVVGATVSLDLVRNHDALTDAAPFYGLCLVLLALPLLAFFALGKRGPSAMASVRRFTEQQSWAVTVIVCVVYLALILS
jgi:hypothetical protein